MIPDAPHHSNPEYLQVSNLSFGKKAPGSPRKKMMLFKLWTHQIVLLLTIIFLAGLFMGCTKPQTSGPLRVAQQYGIGYLPLAIIQTEGLMESIEWSRLSNATAIREAMAGDRLDLGFMGIPPFLLGVDRGTGWQIVTGLSQAPLGLVTLDLNLTSLRDLADYTPRARIALPQPGSIQHILLAMAAERDLGDPKIFDNNLVSLGHPEGLAALAQGRELKAHFTASPFLEQALALPESRLLLSGVEAFGSEFTFLIGVRAPNWGKTEAQRNQLQEFMAALTQAIDLSEKLQQSNLNPEQLALLQRLADFYGISAHELQSQLQNPSLKFETRVRGLEEFISAMDRFGYLNKSQVLHNLELPENHP